MGLEPISRQDCALNKELAYLLGVYLTDGSITEKNFNLQVIDRDFAERTLTCLKTIRPDSTSFLRERNDNTSWNRQKRYVIKVGLGEWADWFRSQTNGKHHIPICMDTAQEGIKKWFIAGVLDGDGFITKTKRPESQQYQYRIGIGGVADGWIYEFRELLSLMRVRCNKIEKFKTKNGRWFCRFTVKPKSFFDAGLFFTIERKRLRCAIASETAR